jgi:Protein of unknown function (DUF2510)
MIRLSIRRQDGQMSYPAPAPQPGWYPDPSGGPGQRYFDGHQWTVSAPLYPAPVARSSPNTALHLALTLLTCGMWLPVWAILVITGNRQIPVQTRRANPALMVVCLAVGGLYLTGLATTNWRMFLALVTVSGAAYFGHRAYERRAARRARDAEIAGRADAQNDAYMHGDASGFYGEYPPADPLQ